MGKLKDVNKKIEETVVDGYKKIENINPPIVPNIISNSVSFFILFSSIY